MDFLIAAFVFMIFLTAHMLFRTLRLRSRSALVEAVQLDEVSAGDAAVRLSAAVQIPTVSREEMDEASRKPLLAMHDWIRSAYPLVSAKLNLTVVNTYSLLFEWKGSEGNLKPVLFNAHLDVVPVPEETGDKWNVEPFSGKIIDGYIWGRGALDMKNQLVALLDAVESLLKKGFAPKRTIYLAFGHDEEISGFEGSQKIAELLKSKGVQLAAVLDEGGLLTTGLLEGVDEQVGVLGITEKGYLTLVLSAQGKPGHSSMPPRQTAVGVISRAVALLDDHPMPARLDFAVPLLERISFLLPFSQQFVIANAWLFKRLLLKRFSGSPQMNAVIRTTHAATMMEGGIKDNILPASAAVKVNCRLLPGDSIQDVIAHFAKVIADPRVSIDIDEKSGGWEASGISPVIGPAYLSLELVIRQVFPNAHVAPYPVVAATDSRYYQPICTNIYKFSPIQIGSEARQSIHGINERVSVEGLGKMVAFFMRLMRVWGDAGF